MSPSTRREWIEIYKSLHIRFVIRSPSTRREWIEIEDQGVKQTKASRSPSTRREWIEIDNVSDFYDNVMSLPPHGGSGLKFKIVNYINKC